MQAHTVVAVNSKINSLFIYVMCVFMPFDQCVLAFLSIVAFQF